MFFYSIRPVCPDNYMYLISKIVILDMGIQLLLSYFKKVVNWFKVKNIDSIKYKAVIVEDSLTIINKNSDIMRHTSRTPHFVGDLPFIHLTHPIAPISFGVNFPQTVMHG